MGRKRQTVESIIAVDGNESERRFMAMVIEKRVAAIEKLRQPIRAFISLIPSGKYNLSRFRYGRKLGEKPLH